MSDLINKKLGAKDMRSLTGRVVEFTSEESKRWVNNNMCGEVMGVYGRESLIGGDYYKTSGVRIIGIAEENGEWVK